MCFLCVHLLGAVGGVLPPWEGNQGQLIITADARKSQGHRAICVVFYAFLWTLGPLWICPDS